MQNLLSKMVWGLGLGVVLAGCGGGGGGGNGNAPVAATLRVTATNAPAVANAAVNSVNPQTAGLGGATGITGGGGAAAASAGRAAAARARAMAHAPESASGRCDVSGTVSVTANDADHNNDISVGDTLSASFSNCRGVDNTTLNGAMSFRIAAVSGDLDATSGWSITLDMTMTNLRAELTRAGVAESYLLNGTLRSALSQITSVVSQTRISTSSLSVQHDGDTETLSDYAFDLELDESTGAYEYFGKGTLTSTSLGGSFICEVPEATAFRGTDFDFPSSGQMRITGLDSSMTITALDALNARLDVDTNADGVADSTQTVAWASLDDDLEL